MKRQQMVNLFNLLGGIEQQKGFDTTFDCNLEKMQELKKFLDALDIEHTYQVRDCGWANQYVVRIDCRDIIDYVTIYTHEIKPQGL